MTRRDPSPDRLFMRSDQLELMDRSVEQQAIEGTSDQDADEHRRAEYTERLRALLPELRKVEGFPIGTDEDILALSDPPSYTACPNPFLAEFIAEHGTPYDEATDDYHREPFAADVSEGKNDPIYNAHSYHTKVPHKAIMRYILHYTKPGDIVFDGFCGTGMTGVAAQLCGSPDPEFRAKVEAEWAAAGHPPPQWGARKAILGDLSPAATFIAYNYNTPVDVKAFQREAGRILDNLDRELGWMYETESEVGAPSRINYTVWSQVLVCETCASDVLFWEVAVEDGEVRASFACPHCQSTITRRSSKPRFESFWDPFSEIIRERVLRIPVVINYTTVGRRTKQDKKPSPSDLATLSRVDRMQIPDWYPTNLLMGRAGEWGDLQRGYHAGIERADDFYFRRGLVSQARLWSLAGRVPNTALRSQLRQLILDASPSFTKRNRFLKNAFSQVNRTLSGTLYVGATASETSPAYAMRGKAGRLRLAATSRTARITTASATVVDIPAGTVDYVFTDPPFGDNLPYSELNFLSESWLRVATAQATEAIVSPVQSKNLGVYQHLMEASFREYFRILKPGRWMTVEFHNSRNSVWNAIQEAIQRAGFVVADVRTLDKQTGTKKQVTSAGAVKQDLVISAYKPRAGFERDFSLEAGTEQGAWDFVRQHLEQLPVFVEHGGKVEVIAERQNYLLYDRMVAFHIQRGATVPLPAGAFYQGLRQRFVERDDMYFTPLQAADYDRRRLEAMEVEQLSVFVVDERSALQWLRAELNRQPQTLQDLTPRFFRELNQNRFEELPELRDMLAQNFLEDPATHRWRVPDPAKQADLQELKKRELLTEFATYLSGTAKLRRFRLEAVRAGIADLWDRRDYRAIIRLCERLPDEVVQEDPALLMYYDNAVTREGA